MSRIPIAEVVRMGLARFAERRIPEGVLRAVEPKHVRVELLRLLSPELEHVIQLRPTITLVEVRERRIGERYARGTSIAVQQAIPSQGNSGTNRHRLQQSPRRCKRVLRPFCASGILQNSMRRRVSIVRRLSYISFGEVLTNEHESTRENRCRHTCTALPA